MIEEKNLKTFIKGTQNYFSSVTGATPEIGTPYEIDASQIHGDFTASIGISGSQRGCVYFTAKREMLEILLSQIGEISNDEELLSDIVGEIANTIAGNAREDLGSGFMISPPHLQNGRINLETLYQKESSFVIPIHWKGYACFVIISLDVMQLNN